MSYWKPATGDSSQLLLLQAKCWTGVSEWKPFDVTIRLSQGAFFKIYFLSLLNALLRPQTLKSSALCTRSHWHVFSLCYLCESSMGNFPRRACFTVPSNPQGRWPGPQHFPSVTWEPVSSFLPLHIPWGEIRAAGVSPCRRWRDRILALLISQLLCCLCLWSHPWAWQSGWEQRDQRGPAVLAGIHGGHVTSWSHKTRIGRWRWVTVPWERLRRWGLQKHLRVVDLLSAVIKLHL